MQWTPNIIIADADYVDRVAFDLTVNFERMIGRRIPKADMARWVECVALDGGMRPSEDVLPHPAPEKTSLSGDSQTQVVLIHDSGRRQMENFQPGDLAAELNGKAFTGRLGEFVFSSTNPEGFTTKKSLFLDILRTALHANEVQRLMIIPDEEYLSDVRRELQVGDMPRDFHTTTKDSGSKSITVFTMQPVAGPFHQEILGYSLMAALGVKGSELKPDEGV